MGVAKSREVEVDWCCVALEHAPGEGGRDARMGATVNVVMVVST